MEVGEETNYVFQTANGDKFGNDRFEVLIESKTNAVANLKSDFNISVYPNPVSQHQFQILGLKNKSNVVVTLTDMMGKQVNAAYENGVVNIQKNITPGTYFVKVNTNEGVAFAKVLIP